MARHPNGPGRLLRGLAQMIRFEPVAALLFAAAFIIAGAVLAQLLHAAGWLPATLAPLRPGLWR